MRIIRVLVVCGMLAARAFAVGETVDLSGNWHFRLDPKDGALRTSGSRQRSRAPKDQAAGHDGRGWLWRKDDRRKIGVLRLVKYYGPAWYQRVIVVPETWKNETSIWCLNA